jgi:hypothetical protein
MQSIRQKLQKGLRKVRHPSKQFMALEHQMTLLDLAMDSKRKQIQEILERN